MRTRLTLPRRCLACYILQPVTSFAIGASVKRREDARLLTGQGRFGRMSTSRSRRMRRSCARLTRMPTWPRSIRSPALALPGVLDVFTGRDLVADGVGHDSDVDRGARRRHPEPRRSEFAEPPWYPLAAGPVRHVGEPVAIVVGDHTRRSAGRRGAVARALHRGPA